MSTSDQGQRTPTPNHTGVVHRGRPTEAMWGLLAHIIDRADGGADTRLDTVDQADAIALHQLGLVSLHSGRLSPVRAGRAALTRHQLRAGIPAPALDEDRGPLDVDAEWCRRMADDEDRFARLVGAPVPSLIGDRYRRIADRLEGRPQPTIPAHGGPHP